MTSRPLFAGVCIVGAMSLVACGGGGDSSSSKSSTTTTTTGASGPSASGQPTTSTKKGSSSAALPDACSLLTDQNLTDLLGGATEGTPSARGTGEDKPLVGCAWGDPITSGEVGLQLSKLVPDTNIDYLETLVDATGAKSESVDVGTDGQLLDTAFVPGGGGVGKSVKFHQSGITVVLGQTGDAVDATKLEAVATDVAAKLS